MKPLLTLVLDADPTRRENLMRLLRQPDRDVVSATDLDGAAERVRSDQFSLLVLDLSFPRLDRGALARALSMEDRSAPEPLDEVERRHLALVLRHTSGNKRKAAHLLGISRSTLLNKVRKYGLES
jgi:DNA-binding NtrC family response regulator